MQRIRGTAGVWGPAAFTGAAVLAARAQPGYSHRSRHVSGLAASGERSARVMVPGFLALGTASLLMDVGDDAVARLLRIAGGTTIAAGLLRASDPSCPQPGIDPEATAGDAGHAAASIATFGLWVALPITASRRPGARWYQQASRSLGVASSIAMVLAAATTSARSRDAGLAQRAFLGTVFAWYGATAVHEASRRPSGGRHS